MANRPASFMMEGGEDLVTAGMAVQPGAALFLENYELVTTGGYKRINGYTPYDGQATPSTTVPGQGDTWLHIWNDELYAVRSNGANDILYKEDSGSGWIVVDLGFRVAYTLGTAQINRGETLTQGGVTGSVYAVSVTSGSWGGGNAAGYIYLHTIAGGNFAAGIATTAGGSATLSGAESANTLIADGQYDFVNYNFYASLNTEYFYASTSVGEAFQYDGNGIAYIYTGANDPITRHIEAHGNRLWIGHNGGDLEFSGIGDPFASYANSYTSGQIGIGAEITGLESLPGGTLVAFTDLKTMLITGNISGASGDMQMREHSQKIGSRRWTHQRILDTYFVHPQGITSLSQTDAFGDFGTNAISFGIKPLFDSLISNVTKSASIKTKSQYRLFFEPDASETKFLIGTFLGQNLLGWSRGKYDFELSDITTGYVNGLEKIFASDTSGNVFQLDEGNDFNGSSYRSTYVTPYYNSGSVMQLSKYRKIVIEVDSNGSSSLKYQAVYDYGSGHPKDIVLNSTITGGGALWGTGTWGSFTWGGGIYGEAFGYLHGTGKNISLVITTNSDNEDPHTIRGISYILETRRLLR